jgi:hypothetical protein
MELERGRNLPAAARDALITESLESLEQGLGEAARVAISESREPGPAQAAEPGELLAELGELRRALAQRGDLVPLARGSGERLRALRGRLEPGALPDGDVAALRELSERLRRGGADPMSAEYPRMVALVSQLELAALRAARESGAPASPRTSPAAAEAARYRDDVAEYYRRLGERQ